MAQNVLDYSENPSGIQLMDTFLAGMAENQLTNHSGVSRPSYAQPGTFWIDTSATPWILKQFTGSGDVVVGTLDQTGLVFTARRALQDGSGNIITSTYLKTTDTAARATADADGNIITSTYLKKTETAPKATADADGNTITSTYLKKTETAPKATADADGNTITSTYAKLASPAFTGTPTAPTPASPTDDSTNIATTAWFNIKCQVVSELPASPVSSVYYFVKE